MQGLIVLASGIAYVLRVNVSFAGPAMKADLGLSEVQLGIVLSAFTTTYALFQIPGGILGEKFGPRRFLTALYLGWGVVTILMGLVPERSRVDLAVIIGWLVLLRGLLGMLQAPFFPVVTGGTQTRWLPPARWGLGNAVQNAGFNLASAAAGPIGVWLILHFGWRQSIVLASPLALGMAAIWWWYNRDNPRDHWRVNEAELQLIAAGRTPVEQSVKVRWEEVFRNRHVVLLTLSYFSINYVYYLFFNWFFYYLTEVRHFSPELGGIFTGAQWILGSVSALIGGVLCDRLSAAFGSVRGCRLTAMGGILIAAPCIVLGAMASNAIVVVTLLSISFASTQLVDAAYWVAAVKASGPRAQLSTGIMNMGGNLSGSFAAILVPIVANGFGWTAGVASGVLFAVIAAVLWLWIKAEAPVIVRATGA